MLYAIISDGGRQLKVEEGQTLDIDFRDLSAGEQIKFDRVLALRNDDGLHGRPADGRLGQRDGRSRRRGARARNWWSRNSAAAKTTAAAPATAKSSPA